MELSIIFKKEFQILRTFLRRETSPYATNREDLISKDDYV